MFCQMLFNPGIDSLELPFKPNLFWIKNLGEGDHFLVDNEESDKTLSFNTRDFYILHEGGYIRNKRENKEDISLILAMSYTWPFMRKVTYIGNGRYKRNVPHDFKTPPDLLIIKNVSNESDWVIWQSTFDRFGYMKINSYEPFIKDKEMFADSAPNRTGIVLGTNELVNKEGDLYVAYMFGYSKYFCSNVYVGKTGRLEIKTQNKPDFLIIKSLDDYGSWRIFSRLLNSKDSLRLNSHGGLTKNDDLLNVELLNDGFVINENSPALNIEGKRFFYFCFTQC